MPEIQGITTGNQNSVTDPAAGGAFSVPFKQPGPNCKNETQGSSTPNSVLKDFSACPPAGVSVVVLPNNQILYWDGLEAEENAKYSIVAEIGDKAVQDQSRLLTLNPAGLKSLNFSDLAASRWTPPVNSDGGANGSGDTQYLLPHMPGILGEVFNDQGQASGALFCSDQVLLSNGEVLVPGRNRLLLRAASARHPPRPGRAPGAAEHARVRSRDGQVVTDRQHALRPLVSEPRHPR